MKRRFVLSLLTLFALSLPVASHAEWVTKEIGWQISGMGGLGGTSIWVRDTTYARYNGVVTSNGGDLDTTMSFAPHGLGVVGKTTAVTELNARGDSLLAGYIVIVGDSTIASTFATGTIAIDGRIGGFGSPVTLGQWVQIDSVSCALPVVNGPIAVFPVRAHGTFGGLKSTLAYNVLRARSSAGVGIMYSARVFWKYWKD